MANSQTRKESPATSNEEISWDETGTIACIKGRYIDLIKKEVRGAVAENIFYHNPHKPMSKFTNLLRPRRHANWLYNLKAGKGKITKDDLEQIASLCKTSVHVLLGGA
jgi:hypothetical protein